MDRITKSLLDEFSREAQIAGLQEDKRFEHFAAYLAVGRHFSETFDTHDVVTGEGADTGIDAVGIVVNGTLVNDEELVAELAEANGYLDVTFIFVQAERSASFDSSKIGQFGFGVVDFFSESPKLPATEQSRRRPPSWTPCMRAAASSNVVIPPAACITSPQAHGRVIPFWRPVAGPSLMTSAT